ncbi:MAG: M23 family metallopeptidase [bacterium]|nr:M23 family metallopeptidase [bacterium]
MSKSRAPFLEIQFHPGDIRSKVRYFFFSRKQVRLTAAGALFTLLFGLFNLFILPGVVRDLLSRSTYQSAVLERSRQGERLQASIARLGRLNGDSEALHLRMSRIYLAYGLQGDESLGQGGFPFQGPPVPDSIYAGAVTRAGQLEAEIREQLQVLDTFISEVQSFESAHGGQVRTTPSVSPLKSEDFVLTSPFGTRRSPFTKKIDFHPGIDMAAPVGTPIYAPADAVVVFAGRYPLKQSVSWWRYGNLVALRNGEGFITLFGHCDEIGVRNGQRVEQGTVIATVGNTGWSTSPHLHYEVRHRDGDEGFRPVDPRIYILDHQWRDEEQLLVRARRAPDQRAFEPLPRIIGR